MTSAVPQRAAEVGVLPEGTVIVDTVSKCICMKNRRHLAPCVCAAPVQKCLVLGCYQPGITPYPPDPKFGKFCAPHADLESETEAARRKCNARLKALGE